MPALAMDSKAFAAAIMKGGKQIVTATLPPSRPF
jgi:hypothetical protein